MPNGQQQQTSDPYAEFGGHTIAAPTSPSPSDPYAAFGGHAIALPSPVSGPAFVPPNWQTGAPIHLGPGGGVGTPDAAKIGAANQLLAHPEQAAQTAFAQTPAGRFETGVKEAGQTLSQDVTNLATLGPVLPHETAGQFLTNLGVGVATYPAVTAYHLFTPSTYKSVPAFTNEAFNLALLFAGENVTGLHPAEYIARKFAGLGAIPVDFARALLSPELANFAPNEVAEMDKYARRSEALKDGIRRSMITQVKAPLTLLDNAVHSEIGAHAEAVKAGDAFDVRMRGLPEGTGLVDTTDAAEGAQALAEQIHPPGSSGVSPLDAKSERLLNRAAGGSMTMAQLMALKRDVGERASSLTNQSKFTEAAPLWKLYGELKDAGRERASQIGGGTLRSYDKYSNTLSKYLGTKGSPGPSAIVRDILNRPDEEGAARLLGSSKVKLYDAMKKFGIDTSSLTKANDEILPGLIRNLKSSAGPLGGAVWGKITSLIQDPSHMAPAALAGEALGRLGGGMGRFAGALMGINWARGVLDRATAVRILRNLPEIPTDVFPGPTRPGMPDLGQYFGERGPRALPRGAVPMPAEWPEIPRGAGAAGETTAPAPAAAPSAPTEEAAPALSKTAQLAAQVRSALINQGYSATEAGRAARAAAEGSSTFDEAFRKAMTAAKLKTTRNP